MARTVSEEWRTGGMQANSRKHGLHLAHGHRLSETPVRARDERELRVSGVVRFREVEPARGVESVA